MSLLKKLNPKKIDRIITPLVILGLFWLFLHKSKELKCDSLRYQYWGNIIEAESIVYTYCDSLSSDIDKQITCFDNTNEQFKKDYDNIKLKLKELGCGG